MMEIIVGHFGIPQGSIIRQGPHFRRRDLALPVKPRIHDMHLAPGPQVHQAPVDDLLQGREIFHSGGEKDNVELPAAQTRTTQVAMYKSEIGVVIEDPGSLLQLCKINVQSRHLRIGGLRYMMTKPAIATADLQHAMAGLELHQTGEGGVFVALGGVEGLARRVIARRGPSPEAGRDRARGVPG